jgi:HSP20 family molecular chaperone IbpA
MKTELLIVALLLAGCDKAKVKVDVQATGDNITVDGTKKDKVEFKKDETGTTVNGQPVKDVDVHLHNGQVDVRTTPPH